MEIYKYRNEAINIIHMIYFCLYNVQRITTLYKIIIIVTYVAVRDDVH